MKSQSLVVDLTGEWFSGLRTTDYLHTKTEHGDVVIFNNEPEYPGMEKVRGKVLWDKVYGLTDERDTERDGFVHALFRKFAKATGTKIVAIRHDNLTTYVDFKLDELKNVEDFEWLNLVLEKDIGL